MEHNKQIAYMEPDDEVQGFFVLKSAAVKVSANGKQYLSAVLSDASGSADAKMWDYTGGIEQYEGTVVKARVLVTEFKGNIQLRIEKIRPAEEKEYSTSDVIPSAPIDSMKELEYVQDLIGTIADTDYRAIAEKMFDRHMFSFGKIPAAKTVHHSFLCGLLMHTANMLRIADFLASNIYPDTVDRSLLLAGTLLHDFGKEKEYEFSALGLANDFTDEGMLVGHLVMCAEEIDRVGREVEADGKKIMLLKHLVLSHHGKPEYGAAVVPCTAESELLSYIDLLDSRMEIYAEKLCEMRPGDISDRIMPLEKRIYCHN